MTRLTDAETDAVLAGGAWQMPVQFAGPEPDHACENCARLQAELDSMRQQRDHFERLALRGRSVAARR